MAETLAYLGTPYSRYEKGLVAAFQDAAKIAARLRVSGIFVYCPIVHLHPLAVYGELDPMDLNLWYPHNQIMMEKCGCLIVAKMDGWDKSSGLAGEIEYFQKMERPIFDLDPESLVMKKRINGGHFDERMHLTLEDMKPFSGPRRELPPLAMPDPKGQ